MSTLLGSLPPIRVKVVRERTYFGTFRIVPTNKEQPPTPYSRATSAAIRARIDRLGVSNAAVARKSGLSANYLNERLRDEKSFTLSDIDMLATYFEIAPARLMREADQLMSVSGHDDTLGTDELPILTASELKQRDLDLAAMEAEGRAIDQP